MNRPRALAALLCALALSACDKNAVQDITGPIAGARIKFFNFGVSAPAVNFYANDTKMTAISSTTGVESTNGVAYGAAGSGGFYASIAPGVATVTGRIAATVDKDLVISTLATTIENGKTYSYYMSGLYNGVAKTTDGFIVEDGFPATFDYSVAYVRFVNAVWNSNPMALIGTNTTTAVVDTIGGLVAYKAGGTFESVVPGVYNLGSRYAGVGTNVISRTNVSFVAGRVYTIAARGDTTITASRALDLTANR